MLWSSASKKPLAMSSLGRARGLKVDLKAFGGSDRWVASLSAIKQGNVFFSGSVDGT